MKNKILIPILLIFILIFSSIVTAEEKQYTSLIDQIYSKKLMKNDRNYIPLYDKELITSKELNTIGIMAKKGILGPTKIERGNLEVSATKDILGDIKFQIVSPEKKDKEGATISIDNKLFDNIIKQIELVNQGTSLKITYNPTGIPYLPEESTPIKEIFIPFPIEGLDIKLEKFGKDNIRVRYESSIEKQIPVKGVKGVVSKRKVLNISSAGKLLSTFSEKNELGNKDYNKLLSSENLETATINAIEYVISPEGAAEIIDVGPVVSKEEKEYHIKNLRGNTVFITSKETIGRFFKREIPILKPLIVTPGAVIGISTATPGVTTKRSLEEQEILQGKILQGIELKRIEQEKQREAEEAAKAERAKRIKELEAETTAAEKKEEGVTQRRWWEPTFFRRIGNWLYK